jgi:hypothetical protein
MNQKREFRNELDKLTFAGGVAVFFFLVTFGIVMESVRGVILMLILGGYLLLLRFTAALVVHPLSRDWKISSNKNRI